MYVWVVLIGFIRHNYQYSTWLVNGNNRCSSQGSIPFTASFLGTSQVSYSTLHLLDQVQTPSSPCPAGSPLFWCSSRWINASDISRYFSDVVHQGFILCLRIETSVFNSSSTPQQGFSGLSAAPAVCLGKPATHSCLSQSKISRQGQFLSFIRVPVCSTEFGLNSSWMTPFHIFRNIVIHLFSNSSKSIFCVSASKM